MQSNREMKWDEKWYDDDMNIKFSLFSNIYDTLIPEPVARVYILQTM